MLQDVRLQCISEVLKVITREFGIDSLVHELKPDEGKKTLISLVFLYPVFDVLETEDDDIEVENVDLRVFIVDGVVGLLEDPLANDNLALILEVGTKSKRG